VRDGLIAKTEPIFFKRHGAYDRVREKAGLMKFSDKRSSPHGQFKIVSSIWQENILRHTGLSYLYQECGSVREVCRQAGNSSDTAFKPLVRIVPHREAEDESKWPIELPTRLQIKKWKSAWPKQAQGATECRVFEKTEERWRPFIVDTSVVQDALAGVVSAYKILVMPGARLSAASRLELLALARNIEQANSVTDFFELFRPRTLEWSTALSDLAVEMQCAAAGLGLPIQSTTAVIVASRQILKGGIAVESGSELASNGWWQSRGFCSIENIASSGETDLRVT
jgi:hypothetical protein